MPDQAGGLMDHSNTSKTFKVQTKSRAIEERPRCPHTQQGLPNMMVKGNALVYHLGQAAQGVGDLVRQPLGILHQDNGRRLRQWARLWSIEKPC